MVGKQKWVVMEEHIDHPVLKLHCIILQEILIENMSNAILMRSWLQWWRLTSIVKQSALTHQPFLSLLEEMDCSYKHIPLHSVVRWLSFQKVLEWFVGCFDASKASQAEKNRKAGQDYPILMNQKCVVKLFWSCWLWLESRKCFQTVFSPSLSAPSVT